MKAKQAFKFSFDKQELMELIAKLEERIGPKAEQVLSHFSNVIGPTVAKINLWCEQRNHQNKAPKRKRTKKPANAI